jgi:hypothetical protein
MKHCSDQVVLAANWLVDQLTQSIADQRGEPLVRCVYAIWKAQHPMAPDLLKSLRKYIYEEIDTTRAYFWIDTELEHNIAFLYLYEMGLADTERFQSYWAQTKSSQRLNGYFQQGDYPNVLLPLARIEPGGEQTRLALNYYIENWHEIASDSCRSSATATALMALHYYDPITYKNLIGEMTEYVMAHIQEMSLKDEDPEAFFRICYLVRVICQVHGLQSTMVAKRVEDIKRLQMSNGAWPNFVGKDSQRSTPEPGINATAAALLALISAGEGPKVSLEDVKRKDRLRARELETKKAHLVVTSPLDASTEIREVARKLVAEADDRLWICSRFITEFYPDIIQLHRDKNIDIRIVTIPLPEAKRVYKGHGKKFVEPAYYTLQRNLESGFKTTSILHARCIISDDTLLVSSADLTKEQLEHELNLGIWTQDPKAVEDAVTIFEAWWDSI